MEGLLSDGNFAELSSKVNALLKRQSWFELHGRELLVLALRIALFTIGFLIFAQRGLLATIVGMITLSYAYYAIGISGTHESRHGAFSRSAWANRLWAYFFSDFWVNQSNEWWHWRHVLKHHVHTNIRDGEPTLFFFPWLPAIVYFFIAPFLVTAWLLLYSVKFLLRTPLKLLAFLVAASAGWVFHVALFMTILPLGSAILATLVMRSLFAPLFMHIAVFNHIALPQFNDKPSWLPHQVKTTRNLKRNWFLDGIGGNAFIECHLEHHLFPTLSNHMLAKIRPLVIEHLKREGHVYIEEGYFTVLRHCLKNYKTIFTDATAAI